MKTEFNRCLKLLYSEKNANSTFLSDDDDNESDGSVIELTTVDNKKIVKDKMVINDGISAKLRSIDQKRSSSFQNLQKQATKMKQMSENRFCHGKIGENVMIRIPDVDRARCVLRNILGVILSVKDNLYEIGTKEGKINQIYSCNQFKLSKESFITTEEVPENIISLRGRHTRMCQGYNRCGCTQKCKTKKCKCKAAGKLCNSKCHSSNPCSNK
ncbi:unnamed protein product [Macrosiphum euphorbiae]|uniref:KRAB-A domain-containing 2-like n=1 Tax=Macrosiphum euphorbiae TaxID=13131 RepID=A0AAV0WCV0_9HEMI|nr:unnamed protein product [Macrosiphum euphorbiae]